MVRFAANAKTGSNNDASSSYPKPKKARTTKTSTSKQQTGKKQAIKNKAVKKSKADKEAKIKEILEHLGYTNYEKVAAFRSYTNLGSCMATPIKKRTIATTKGKKRNTNEANGVNKDKAQP
ncbi:hypothetical protein F4860DRAFT_514986 [Xylaria cubensis]|nr:hypothetical protein F4860DRAFT_514986 [Xylaria cubensis]